MKSIKSLFYCLTIGYFATMGLPAVADQCAYISKEQAMTVVSRLQINQTIFELCEPCGEKEVIATQINNLSMAKVDYQDYWQVEVNERGIDLAYVFIDAGNSKDLVNLGIVANCRTRSVSSVLPRPGNFPASKSVQKAQ